MIATHQCARPAEQRPRVVEGRVSVMLWDLSGARTQSARLQGKLARRDCAKPFSEGPGLVRHRVSTTTERESHSLHYHLGITARGRFVSRIPMRSAAWYIPILDCEQNMVHRRRAGDFARYSRNCDSRNNLRSSRLLLRVRWRALLPLRLHMNTRRRSIHHVFVAKVVENAGNLPS